MAPTTPKAPTIVLGVANVGDKNAEGAQHVHFDTPDEVNAFLDEFYNRGYRNLDTARVYPPTARGTSEPRLGAAGVGDRFIIDTKVWSWTPGDHNAANIERSVDESLEALRVPQVNIEYLHVPERTTPFEETVRAIDAQKKAGKFRKFGISNYKPEEVKQLVDIAKTHGYQAPQVYQGSYNAVSRDVETELFPLLRENNISFYAYSPTAGGLFSDKAKEAREGDRYDPKTFFGNIYGALYNKPAIADAVDKVRTASKKNGITGHEAALRWVVYHSALSSDYGDAVIIGASSIAQLKSNLDAIDAGPLPQEVLDAVNAIYTTLSEEDRKGFKF